ncbi:heme ABC transporter permease [Acidiferrobacter thiooxydans]|jgi:heme exporter protein C|nr:heme ABC transporter permease [Acidiferrobacter thiooxydans]
MGKFSGLACVTRLMKLIHKYGAPKRFYELAGTLTPWFAALTTLLFVSGLYLGLYWAPPDYQQGNAYRIMFVHVPNAWMSMMAYVVMAVFAAAGYIWNIRLADILAKVTAPLGASFTLTALVTGSLWGKPMWGTYWVWDARLTSELVLFFLYVGYMALQASIDDPRRAAHASAILAIVGVVNVPIIHYSVYWWHTLHQPASLSLTGQPKIYITMLIPLIIMSLGFMFFYLTMLCVRARSEILWRERRADWVRKLIESRS